MFKSDVVGAICSWLFFVLIMTAALVLSACAGQTHPTPAAPVEFLGLDGTCHAGVHIAVYGVPVSLTIDGEGNDKGELLGRVTVQSGALWLACQGTQVNPSPVCAYGIGALAPASQSAPVP